MSKSSKTFQVVDVSRLKGDIRVHIGLKREFSTLPDFLLRWYLDSLVGLYANEGFPMVFTPPTQAVYESIGPAAAEMESSLTVGQRILLDGVARQLSSPANGCLDLNMRILVLLQSIFASQTFEGNPKHLLRYTVRHNGDRTSRILTMKEDLVALYGAEPTTSVLSALRVAFKREEGKGIFVHGITHVGMRPAFTNWMPVEWLKLNWAFNDELQRHDSEWIKAHFKHIVAIVQYFEREAEQFKKDAEQVAVSP